MEISGKVLREVEFRDRLRGYDTDEVDEFLEKVAVGVDDLRAELEQLTRRAERAERRAEEAAATPRPGPAAPAAPVADDDAIRRTLVLAQRTADMAVAEAREEASRLVEEARGAAETLVTRAEESARRLRDDAEQELHVRIGRLAEERERLERDVQHLARLVEGERARLTESLSSALRVVGETLSLSDDLAEHRASAEQRASMASPPEPVFPTTPQGPPVREEPSLPGRSSPGGEGGSVAEEPVAERPLFEAPPSDPVEVAEEPEEPGPRARALREEEGGGARPGLVPDVESEIAQDAASAYGGPPRREPTSTVRVLQPSEDPEEALWERWAAGKDLGVVPGPEDFSAGGGSHLGRGKGGDFSA